MREVIPRAADWPSMDPDRLRLALAQLPARLREACKLFHELTGLTAVVGIQGPSPLDDGESSIQPPIHPNCSARVGSLVALPCNEAWQRHIAKSLRSRRPDSHLCQLGLLCACVPIHFGDKLVGVAKVVTDSRTSAAEFSAATATLA